MKDIHKMEINNYIGLVFLVMKIRKNMHFMCQETLLKTC